MAPSLHASTVFGTGRVKAMMWMLLGIGSVLHAGAPEVLRKDSTALIELRSRLPSDLKAKVELAHAELTARRDTLSHLSTQEKTQWLDSLRREAKTRRTRALDNLTPEERGRVEARLRRLEHMNQNRPAKSSNPGLRQ
ncbi:MAG: hypothetical protein RL173_832 [Fibrobacterota bacterium]|jgi:hypothetical protein